MDEIQKKTEIVAWLLARFEAEKTKILTTAALLCVMGFMWFKVLSGNQPESARAAAEKNGKTETENTVTNLEYIELPVIQQRHEKLDKDFFSADQAFGKNRNSSANVIDGNNGKKINAAAETLSLEAIFTGQSPEVFINDRIMTEGDFIEVERDNKKYKFKLEKIMNNKVRLKCNDTLVEIEIAGAEFN